MNQQIKVIISGGGTGGHIFPAISIANALKQLYPNIDILFVGAEGRMEMEKVPAAGYPIIGLPVSGLDRKNLFKNFKVIFRLIKSLFKAKKIIEEFKPNVVVGVGGYASAPVLKMAQRKGIYTVIQEQNSYAGVTNKWVAKNADKICVAYENMDRFFPKDKIIFTGNPVRQSLLAAIDNREEAYEFFGFDKNKKTLLIVGGSLGARTINNSVIAGIKKLISSDIQVIWQTGKFYINEAKEAVKEYNCPNLYVTDFVMRMDYAYCIADLVVSRAGASSISELSLLGRPSILVPSPNVAEDHQTKNAMALVNKNAAVMISDDESVEKLVEKAVTLIRDGGTLIELSKNIKYFARERADKHIASEILSLLGIKTERISNIENYYFIGIGGIGMSALARYFNNKGFNVAGYDRAKTALTESLEREGISIHYEDKVSAIAPKYRKEDKTIVVVTPAIPLDNAEYQYFKNNQFEIKKRAELLGKITKMQKALCVSGTHGKTTTSTMLAHLLTQSGVATDAFLGGISVNYNTNLLLKKDSDYVVIEADEYDRSFHNLTPNMAVVTSTDADHLDIYTSAEEYLESFSKFTSLITENGLLLMKKGLTFKPDVKSSVKVMTYSSTEPADFFASNMKTGEGTIFFDFNYPEGVLKNVEIPHAPIKVNVENAVAAMAIAWLNGVSADELKKGIASYRGVKRRFEKHVDTEKVVYIDDYAHHPAELRASILSVKELYPNKKLTGIFQPHLYTRTRDFADDFAKSLSLLDSLILLDIYPAREQPIEGVTSKIIFDKVTIADKLMTTKESLLDILKTKKDGVVMTLGAGDIDKMIPQIKEVLK